MQKGFVIEEPDFPQHKQRKVQSATVVGAQQPTDSDDSDHVIDFKAGDDDEQNDEPSGVKGQSKAKRRPDSLVGKQKLQQKRKLLGLDRDLAGEVKARPTSISKDVLNMFAT